MKFKRKVSIITTNSPTSGAQSDMIWANTDPNLGAPKMHARKVQPCLVLWGPLQPIASPVRWSCTQTVNLWTSWIFLLARVISRRDKCYFSYVKIRIKRVFMSDIYQNLTSVLTSNKNSKKNPTDYYTCDSKLWYEDLIGKRNRSIISFLQEEPIELERFSFGFVSQVSNSSAIAV